MAFPAILALIGSILGKKKDDAYQMELSERGFGDTRQPTIGEAVQPNTMRTFDNDQGEYINSGQSNGEVQPGQRREYNQGSGGFQNAVGTIGTIGSIVGGLQNKKEPYQMRMRRR